MSILNRPSDGLLSVLLALRRTLIAYGPQADSRLLELCAPESDVLRDPGMARRTLTRWTQLGLFEVQGDGEMVSITAAAQHIDADDLRVLRAFLVRLVLAPQNNPGLAAEEEGDDEAKAENSMAADFSVAASWALAQDPWSFARTYGAAEAMLSEQRMKRKIFANDTRWSGFVQWAPFLGVGYKTKSGMIPNPAFAIACMIDEVFAGETELTLSVFLDRLAVALPIVDGGQYRRLVDEATGQPWRVQDAREVSPCLSIALLTLMEQKTLRLEPRSDAAHRTLLSRGGREGHKFSHVVRARAA